MNVLVIGSGGREHALVWKLAQSAGVKKVFAAPGNGGTAGETKCENIAVAGDISEEKTQTQLLEFAKQEHIDLTIIGPEAPLAGGIVDRFRAAGLAVIGPDKNAARLETSKAFSKSFMEKYGIRTARGKTFHGHEAALRFVQGYFEDTEFSFQDESETQPEKKPPALVVKADGLAAGKGVIIATDLAEAEAALASFMLDKSLGEAGATVVLEEYIEGTEISILAALSASPGKKPCILPFVSARDHKRRFDGAKGPNTGGMGAIAPVPDFSDIAQKDFMTAILEPTLRGINAEGMDYRGFIFFGLMIRKNRCYLLEYNVRLGDPETQAVLPLLDSDLSELCKAMLDHSLEHYPLLWKSGAVCAPVAVASGYPGAFRKGDPITIDNPALKDSGAKIFFAGTTTAQAVPGHASPSRTAPGKDPAPLITSGGRVLAASAWGADPDEAREKAYRALKAVNFDGMDYRTDIGRE
ncbi:MAG: phosphoribosylamine--glycine ligase [Spirochaetaceae bacterium]|jgi:phosphoribosylamine--glycine ligase|nr:phosphoribosylamine--glycine ligase [Spirochaetaceae bacterium]